MNKPLLKWSPAVPIRKPDNIISSHTKRPFKASYENDPIENMNFLMSNEYMRIWFQEKGVYDKDTYTREQIIKEESKIKRRIIQRMMTYRKPTKNQFIDDDIQRRAEHKSKKKLSRQEQCPEKMKYKPTCPTKTGSQIKAKSKTKRQDRETSKIVKDSEEKDECDDSCEIVVCPLNYEQGT